MSPFFRKDRLKQQPELRNPVSAQALVVRGDPGYSAMSWWSASIKLQVAVPGKEPLLVEHDGNVIREKTPVAGSVLPVDVERDDPTQVRIRWDEVPTIEQRIADRDPLIFDPEGAWRFVLEADPRQAEAKPAWGNGALPGWPSSDALGHGRKPGTALVIAHSWDPGGNVSGGFAPPHAGRYSFGGTIETGLHTYLGWLLLCVNPYDGERYGLAVETKIRRDRFGPVLPLAIHPDQPGDIDIVWESAPEAPPPPSTGTQVANTIVHGGQVIAARLGRRRRHLVAGREPERRRPRQQAAQTDVGQGGDDRRVQPGRDGRARRSVGRASPAAGTARPRRPLR